MPWADVIAAVMLASLAIYSVTGGADFGGGVWDLLARGPRAKDQRRLIAKVLAPIWEANHVWLIIVVVLLFVGFPRANTVIATALHIPLTLMLLGIVLRGTAFVFRAYDVRDDETQARWSLIFAIASIGAPFFLGTALGAVASGSLRLDPATGLPHTDFVSEWLAPFPLVVGAWVVTLNAYLAAVYLTCEARDDALIEDFRTRALAAGVGVGAMALLALVVAQDGAPAIAHGLTAKAWSIPFHILTGIVSIAALGAVWRRQFRWARSLAIAQVMLIVLGWGVSQFPYVVAPDLTIEAAAAGDEVLVPVAMALAAGILIVVPAFAYLYRVFRVVDLDEH